ncbi:SDR family NAD(P)-dependent oxidoreductase [Chroococcidiopsis sp. FACHB-1243]|uniref:SDR family NAD(P)-dependent oxidoreductase n=1 Tax=Chroococcidiopsis sp. [FACHB-1243] TaxID=2692781 RepID=UPI001783D20C|nr:SDR family NAD(P)-dependent oxidoreductase [Chroococcidiopsis sp. [FACHB-1243]]MBD2310015.1 SDR family NAD(P)-dependent oxidoreductase [Chroococcidiopsis sp. [FACHB-1243]]
MTKKVVFITGANKGIGYEVARQLAANEFIVLLGARNPQRGEVAANKLRAEGEVHFVPIDVTDDRSPLRLRWSPNNGKKSMYSLTMRGSAH